MTALEDGQVPWDPRELEFLKVVDLFETKPAILLKAEERLNRLKEAMVRELANGIRQVPPGADCLRGQLARGENHKGFPFRSLDIPQFFSKDEMFTFRTLFWWGHYLGFALILKGGKFADHTGRLADAANDPQQGGVFLSRTASPWEWELTPENYLDLSRASREEVRDTLGRIQHIKLLCRHPVQDPIFENLDWSAAGVETYRRLIRLALG